MGGTLVFFFHFLLYLLYVLTLVYTDDTGEKYELITCWALQFQANPWEGEDTSLSW